MLNQIVRPIVRSVARNGTRSASSKVVEIKLPTINDLPVPNGPWQQYYDKRQKVYNTQLIIGSTVLLGTLIFIKVSGIIFFNFRPPLELLDEDK